MQNYPIGTPGKPWGEEEKAQWKGRQNAKRSYQEEVLKKLFKIIPEGFDLKQYGALPYDTARYPLYAVIPKSFDANKPSALVTGGVHGYETSGVQGALQFIETKLSQYAEQLNIVVVPCVSPWGYETINRWNPLALDPNRSFYKDSPAPESAQLMKLVSDLALPLTLHIDLHETTDTDNSEFRVVSEGVICYDKKALYLCGGMTDAKYVTTTEVYPDSDNATPKNCNDAQVAAICAALDYVK